MICIADQVGATSLSMLKAILEKILVFSKSSRETLAFSLSTGLPRIIRQQNTLTTRNPLPPILSCNSSCWLQVWWWDFFANASHKDPGARLQTFCWCNLQLEIRLLPSEWTTSISRVSSTVRRWKLSGLRSCSLGGCRGPNLWVVCLHGNDQAKRH